MEDLSHDQISESEQNIATLSEMSFADLKEEAELDKVDFEIFLEEIRASWQGLNVVSESVEE